MILLVTYYTIAHIHLEYPPDGCRPAVQSIILATPGISSLPTARTPSLLRLHTSDLHKDLDMLLLVLDQLLDPVFNYILQRDLAGDHVCWLHGTCVRISEIDIALDRQRFSLQKSTTRMFGVVCVV